MPSPANLPEGVAMRSLSLGPLTLGVVAMVGTTPAGYVLQSLQFHVRLFRLTVTFAIGLESQRHG